MKIGLLHYSGPPVVGGVEQTLYFHSQVLSDAGHQPVLLVGEGSQFDPRVEVRLIPILHSRNPLVISIKQELDKGVLSRGFGELKNEIEDKLVTSTHDLDMIVVHNALTLHKNLPLTAALFQIHQSKRIPPLIGWHHDFAWERKQYQSELYDREPWVLLKQPWPGVVNVVVSEHQQVRLANLYKTHPKSIHVIPPGFDPAVSGNWTPQMRQIVNCFDLMQADLVLLHPTRITRRKNIEYGIHVMHSISSVSDLDSRLIIPGPPGPHNPSNQAYLDSLIKLCHDLSLDSSVHFIYKEVSDLGSGLDQATMACLFHFSDGLLFPSIQEGFGIPILEAAYSRLPIFCSNIPAFQESGQQDVHFFNLDDPPEEVAQHIIKIISQDPAYLFRRRVMDSYTWKSIVEKRVLPVLNGTLAE